MRGPSQYPSRKEIAWLNGVIEESLLKVLLAEVWAGLGESSKGWYKILQLETVGSFLAQRIKRTAQLPESIKNCMRELLERRYGLCSIDLGNLW